MSEYLIGRDVQELRSRIERCEAAFSGGHGAGRRFEAGRARHDLRSGIDHEKKPILWKSKKSSELPLFFYPLLGLFPQTHFDLQPKSKTWACVPEPMTIQVIWDTGAIEDHVQFSNQVFSLIKVSDPNTGITTATAIYSATMTSKSGQSIDYAGGNLGPGPVVPPYYVGPYFPITLRNAGGAGLSNYYQNFSVACGASIPVNFSKDFPAGLYDLVTGATWQLPSWSVGRC